MLNYRSKQGSFSLLPDLDVMPLAFLRRKRNKL